MIRTTIVALAGVLALTPAHCYSIWRYPWAQKCGVQAPPRKVWFVEVTKVPPAEARADTRSPEDIADQAEHDRVVAFHHDEINFLMSVLKSQEAAGMK